MKLYIAEKPSLGRAIAAVLPKPHQKGDGFIKAGNGDVVSWCIGHLLEQFEPDDYDSQYKKWRLEDLPIIPEKWQLKPKYKTKKQLSVLRKLIKESSSIVHAGDPDREGQLLVDEVIDYLGVKGTKKDSIQRVLISDLNPSAVKRAISSPRSNKEFVPLSVSALARARADWLFGMNMTRAYTVQGKKAGYNGVLSVGRVQTPLLGLVVRRDEEIENFASKPFYEVNAILHKCPQLDKQFDPILAKWVPSEACRPYQDEDGRVLSKALAENVSQRITNKPARVSKLTQKKKQVSPPLPFNLSALQIEAAKLFGMNAKAVLDTCQKLYEQHKLITYPRSDSRHLPKEQLKQASTIVATISNNLHSLSQHCKNADLGLVSKAWNDKKVDAHHAIIPTEKKADLSRLSKQEMQLYSHIARQYLFQFYPAYEYLETRAEFEIEGGKFVASANQMLKPGWKALLNKENISEPQLPPLAEGEQLHCKEGKVLQKHTQPPAYFTDATLLSAMTGIARFVENSDIRKILKETDGIGTEATRAGIIELLFKRGFLQRIGKQIRATEAGKGLIRSLPDTATKPDMTAQWEFTLNEISHRQESYSGFMAPLMQHLHHLIEQAASVIPSHLQGIKQPARKNQFARKKHYKKKVAS